MSRIKNKFPEKISDKICETNSSALISIFQKFFVRIDKSFNLAGRLNTRASFYKV